MLRRSASDAGRKGDPADGGGVGQAGPPAEAGEACRLPPSRGRDPFVMILETQQLKHLSQNNGSSNML